ncbi:MAG: molybdopterin cofactor-binding domain-containing protein, partial [Bacillota bacterium]
KRLPYREIARIAASRGETLKAEGDFIWPVADKGVEGCFGLPHLIYSYITQIALVEVDTLTGMTEVLKVTSIPDPGRAINPQGIEGQSEGGVVMGTGYALTEDTIIEKGITMTPNFSTYMIPTSMDAPEIETIIVEEEEPSGPFGAKGIGEAVCVPITPAITNAIHDATGVWLTRIPATSERVYMALKERAG